MGSWPTDNLGGGVKEQGLEGFAGKRTKPDQERSAISTRLEDHI
jgi:hypothetical protein